MKQPGGTRHAWRLAAVVLGVVLLIPHVPLLRGQAMPIWDAFGFFAPYQMLTGDLAREGRWLLWNPYIKGGSPDHLEPQVGAFSPLVLLFGLIGGGSRHTFELYWLTVWFLGPAGILVLARHLGAPVWGGLAAALGLAFSFYTGNAQHTSMLSSLSALPWMLWRLDVALRDRMVRPSAEAGALWGLSALAGNPPFLLVNFCFASLWTIGRAVLDRPRSPSSVINATARAAAILTLAGVVGVAVMSPTYAGFFVDGPGYTHRTGPLPREVAIENDALHPRSLVTLASPSLARADIFEYTDISMRSVYMGILIPVLALVALMTRGDRVGLRWWLFALAIGFILISLGRVVPLRGWLYDWFPLTRYFRHPALFRCYFIIALAILSLFGARDLQSALERRERHWWRRFAMASTCIAALALAVYTVALAWIPAAQLTPEVTAHLHTWGLWLSLCAMAWIGFAFDWTRRARLVPAVLIAVAVADALSTARISSVFMYGQGAILLPGYTVQAWRGVDAIHRADTDLTPNGLERKAENGLNLTLIMKIPTLAGYGPLTGPLLDRSIADPVLSAAATGTDRVWFASRVASMERSEDCFEAFRARAAALGAPPLVIHDRPTGPPSSPAGLPRTSCRDALADLPAARRLDRTAVRVLDYRHERLALEVEAPEPGWLLVTDAWARAWTARVNGAPAPVLPGNFVWRAVQVPAGRTMIDFEYHPFGLPWLVALSWGTLAVIGACSIRAAAGGGSVNRPSADST